MKTRKHVFDQESDQGKRNIRITVKKKRERKHTLDHESNREKKQKQMVYIEKKKENTLLTKRERFKKIRY